MDIILCGGDSRTIASIRSTLTAWCARGGLYLRLRAVQGCEALLSDAEVWDCDVVFMDLSADAVQCLATASLLQDEGYAGWFVFVRASKEYALDCFFVNVADFLTEPIAAERLTRCMEKLRRLIEPTTDAVRVTINGSGHTVCPKDICMIETGGDHSTLIHFLRRRVQSTTLISELDSQLSLYPSFFRCHRSYLINMDHVTHVEGACATMRDGSRALLSVRNAPAMRQKIAEHQWTGSRPIRKSM